MCKFESLQKKKAGPSQLIPQKLPTYPKLLCTNISNDQKLKKLQQFSHKNVLANFIIISRYYCSDLVNKLWTNWFHVSLFVWTFCMFSCLLHYSYIVAYCSKVASRMPSNFIYLLHNFSNYILEMFQSWQTFLISSALYSLTELCPTDVYLPSWHMRLWSCFLSIHMHN